VTALSDIAKPLRAWLADEPVREAALLSKGYQGSVYLYEHAGRRWVVKRAGQGLLSGWFHRLMLSREAAVYEKLGEVTGVPEALGLLDGEWLVLEFIDGESLQQARHELQDREGFYARLHAVIQAMHAADVAHGDLKRKENILVMADESPCIIDFGTALRRDGAFFDRLLFATVARADFNAWIKVKYANDYSQISAEDARWYRPGLLEAVLRKIRQFWRLISFRRTRKGWRRRRDQ
jgi:predicted Ser/Thr protein kinase